MGLFDSIFGGKKKPQQQPPSGGSLSLSMRDTLFGDTPVDQWKAKDVAVQEGPWRLFALAREHLEHGEKEAAVARWRELVMEPGLEPRFYLQAWHFLRSQGEMPPPELAKRVLGVVVEISFPDGLELIAAYSDHAARYYNHIRGGVIWEHADTSLDGVIDELFTAAARVIDLIGPSEGPRPAPPPLGQARLNFLTPSGLHYGQGGFDTLSNDPMGGPVLQAALKLMRALMAKSSEAKS